MNKQRKIVIVLAGIFIAAFFWQIGKKIVLAPATKEADKKIMIVTTLYPLQNFAEAVGGDVVSVKNIVPVGAEPHDYEPTPQDIVSIYQSDIFLLNGAGIDSWAEKIQPELEKRGVTVIKMSDVVSLLPDRSARQENIFDPHFWLDPVWAAKEAEVIKNTLIARDTSNSEIYTQNAKQYIALLGNADTAYQEGLRQCTLHTIVTSHNAFTYLAKRYGFEVISVSGTSPEAEASPRALVEIANTVQTLGLKYIFFETLVSPKVAETLAKEVGAATLVFNPLEGLTRDEQNAGKNYLSIMQTNLDNLQTALQCQK